MDAKRVTANLPAGLLRDAMAVTGEGITETLVEGLKLVRQSGTFKCEANRGLPYFRFSDS